MSKWTTLLDYIEDYARKALDRFPSRYRGKKGVEALISGLAAGAQLLEDVAFDVLVSTGLDTAAGESLDHWGELVGLQRQGFRDEVYRRFIRAQIQINNAAGTTNDVIAIYETLTGPSYVRHHSHYPHGFRLTAYRNSFMGDDRANRVVRMFDRAKPAGVAVSLAETISETDVTPGYSLARTL